MKVEMPGQMQLFAIIAYLNSSSQITNSENFTFFTIFRKRTSLFHMHFILRIENRYVLWHGRRKVFDCPRTENGLLVGDAWCN